MIKDYQPNTETHQGGYQSSQGKHENLLQELKAANKKHRREIKDLRGKNKKLLDDLDKSEDLVFKLKKELEKRQRDLEEFEKDLVSENEKVKDYKRKLQAERKTTDKLKNAAKQQVCKETKSLQKKLDEEESKCNDLTKKVRRLRLTSKQMPGRKWFL